MNEEKDWKLKLRYGKLKTSFKHVTLIMDGEAHGIDLQYNCTDGRAIMSIKMWAEDFDQAVEMAIGIGNEIGFKTAGKVEIYETDPEKPPGESPFGYDINFISYEKEE